MDLTSEQESQYFFGALGYGDAAAASTKPLLSSGSKDTAAVRELQTLLIAKGENLGSYGADGSYGPATIAAVKSFQAKNGLPATGVTDSGTWAALLGGGAGKQDKALQTLDTIFQGIFKGASTFAPLFGPKQDVPATGPAGGGGGGSYIAPQTGMSAGAKIGLGVVGVAVVGGFIYLLVKR
jgi:peptidoglycan hydrolase-like protein with peptidoglycan-binding domain